MRVFSLHNYICVRDCYGNLIEAITKEEIDKAAASDEVLALIGKEAGADDDNTEKTPKPHDHDNDDKIEIYTIYFRDGNKLYSYQEVNGIHVPGSDGKWPIDASPLLVLRWTHIDGENYGRGRVEECLGDLVSLEGLSRSIVEGTAAASRVVYTLNPNGMTNHSDFSEAESGDVISGKAEDITCVQSQKQADLTVAAQMADRIEKRLSLAFLMNIGIQRDAERVTGTEIRAMIEELDATLRRHLQPSVTGIAVAAGQPSVVEADGC